MDNNKKLKIMLIDAMQYWVVDTIFTIKIRIDSVWIMNNLIGKIILRKQILMSAAFFMWIFFGRYRIEKTKNGGGAIVN